MTITVDDVIALKQWREEAENKPTIELLDIVIDLSCDEDVQTMCNYELMARRIVAYDVLINRFTYNTRLSGLPEVKEKKISLRERMPDDVRKLLQAVEP